MAFQIPGIDLNPNAGNSWMGLTRDQAKKVANIFLIVGLLFAIPPFVPDPTDFLSLWLARAISNKFSMPFNTALVWTYFAGMAIFFMGAWIYPYNTHSLLNGYITKAKTYIKKAFRSPKFLLFNLIMLILLFRWYETFV